MPSDVTGVSVLRDRERAAFEFQPGPVFTDLLLADEINRAPAKTQSALLEAMQERQVTVDGDDAPAGAAVHRVRDAEPGRVRGHVPAARGAARPLPAQDRRAAIPTREAELRRCSRATRTGSTPSADATPRRRRCSTRRALRALRGAVDDVRVAPEVRAYIAADRARHARGRRRSRSAARRARPSRCSARRARPPLLDGRDFVTPDDVKALAPAVLRHRVRVAPELEVEGRSADDVLPALLTRVPAPQ